MADQGITQQAAIHQRVIAGFIEVQPWPRGALSVPMTQAHRGYWKDGVQENTLAAFRAAREKGAQMIELDVRLSADRIPIVFHDEDISRFSGLSSLVRDLTAVQLKEKVNAPSLAEVLSDPYVPEKINIELKTDRILDEALERKVFEVVEAGNAFGRVLFSSFNPFSLWRMSLFTEKIPLALLVSDDLKQRSLREMWFAPALKFHALHLNHKLADAESLRYWRSKGVPVAVWTVNEEALIAKLLSQGCLSVISDEIYPSLI